MRYLSRLLSAQAIGIVDGRVKALKGNHTNQHLLEIAQTCQLNNIQSGEIWIGSTGKITFSREIPKDKHQQFRNVIFCLRG